jgi:hypothetical protein
MVELSKEKAKGLDKKGPTWHFRALQSFGSADGAM